MAILRTRSLSLVSSLLIHAALIAALAGTSLLTFIEHRRPPIKLMILNHAAQEILPVESEPKSRPLESPPIAETPAEADPEAELLPEPEPALDPPVIKKPREIDPRLLARAIRASRPVEEEQPPDEEPAPVDPVVPAVEVTDPSAAHDQILDGQPLAMFAPSPAYPLRAFRLRLEGTVVLVADVSADGSVKEALVEQSSGHAALDEAARKALLQWTFRPRSSSLPYRVRVPFVFSLAS